MGRYDASYGWCFLGDSSYGFKPLMPVRSGLKIKGDARKILPVDVLGKHYLVAAINDDDLRVFELLK